MEKKEKGRVVLDGGGLTPRSVLREVTLCATPTTGVCTVGGERVTVTRRRFLEGPQYVPGIGVTPWSAWSVKS